jgi:hypothetical protein
MTGYIEPIDLIQGQKVRAPDWNLIINDLIIMQARMLVLEAAVGGSPADFDFPVGGIIAWTGTAASIPAGWQVCDGTNGTKNLRGCFIYGAAVDGDVGDSGGALTHTHTAGEAASGGSHMHTVSIQSGSAIPAATDANAVAGSSNYTQNPHTHLVSGNTAPGGAHTHTAGTIDNASSLPPYVKVYLIQRMS